MNELTFFADQRRNKNFEQTHRQLIERAVELIGEVGESALTVALLAREAGMNRSTVYYHFDSRETLIAEIKQWIGRQLGEIILGHGDPVWRVEQAVLFVLAHPAAVNLWVMDLIQGHAITQQFPQWDTLVMQVERDFLGHDCNPDGARADIGDGELWSTVLLSIAVGAPRLYQFSVRPSEDHPRVARRFARAYMRLRASMCAPVL